jgi:hypothetical protein
VAEYKRFEEDKQEFFLEHVSLEVLLEIQIDVKSRQPGT